MNAELNESYISMPITVLDKCSEKIPFSVFIRLSQEKYVQIFSNQVGLDKLRLAKYKTKISTIYIKKNEQELFDNFIKATNVTLDPAEVAKELLGKLLVRKLGNNILIGKVVETEAYYDKDDPASRAYKGLNKISELMFGEVGKLLVYTVHANLLMNIISHKSDEVGAVLIRALEPINGIREMK